MTPVLSSGYAPVLVGLFDTSFYHNRALGLGRICFLLKTVSYCGDYCYTNMNAVLRDMNNLSPLS